MFQIGDIVGNTYRLTEEIGSGGLGVIYKAYHLRLKKYVVLKKIKNDYIGVVNNRSEVDLLKNLHHSYLPQVFDFLQFGAEVFTVMEYVDGRSLDDCLNSGVIFNENDLIRWLKEMLEVLTYLHGQKPAIFHNDIKPGNIMITKDGHACLIDFNISLEETESDKIIGISANYASPEQKEKAALSRSGQYHENIQIDGRSDLYSLGKTFIRLIQNGNYSEGLNNILEKATAEEKKARFKNADQMLKSLENICHYDSEYLQYRYYAIIGRSFLAILLIISVLMMFWGYHTSSKENFARDCQELKELSDQCDYNGVVEKGIQILNNPRYSGSLKNKNVEILYSVANGYFGEENYSEAIKYYEEALSSNITSEEKGFMLRDCAIAYAKAGNNEQAENLLNEAISSTMDTCDLNLIKGEIEYAQDNFTEAVKHFSDAVSTSRNEASRSEALRRCGKLYFEMKQYQKASACFKDVVNQGSATFEDKMNLALCYEANYKYEESKSVLMGMKREYSDDYRIYMCLSRVSMRLRNASDAKSYYQKAKTCYQKSNAKNSDVDMEALMEEME